MIDSNSLTFLDGELLQSHRNAAVREAVTAYKDVISGVKGRSFLEDILPADSAAHIDLTLVEGEQVGPAILDLTDSEVAVVAGVGEFLVRDIFEDHGSLRGHFLLGGLEVHVNPILLGL